MAFRKPSRQSFFSSRVSPFLPSDRYFHKTSKRTIREVSHHVSHRIKDTKSVILWGVYSDWFAISRNSAQTYWNARNDKCIASFSITIYGGGEESKYISGKKAKVMKYSGGGDRFCLVIQLSFFFFHCSGIMYDRVHIGQVWYTTITGLVGK